IDVGTGSGAIAITVKLEKPECNVYATEISKDAFDVARDNAKKLGANVEFFEGNLLEPFVTLNPKPYTPYAVMANLPYVPDDLTINESAMHEPKIAIFGGKDGLDLYQEMFNQ